MPNMLTSKYGYAAYPKVSPEPGLEEPTVDPVMLASGGFGVNSLINSLARRKVYTALGKKIPTLGDKLAEAWRRSGDWMGSKQPAYIASANASSLLSAEVLAPRARKLVERYKPYKGPTTDIQTAPALLPEWR